MGRTEWQINLVGSLFWLSSSRLALRVAENDFRLNTAMLGIFAYFAICTVITMAVSKYSKSNHVYVTGEVARPELAKFLLPVLFIPGVAFAEEIWDYVSTWDKTEAVSSVRRRLLPVPKIANSVTPGF